MWSQKFAEVSPQGICLPSWLRGVSIFQRASSLRQNNSPSCFVWRTDSSILKEELPGFLLFCDCCRHCGVWWCVSKDFMWSQFRSQILPFSQETRACIRTSLTFWGSELMLNLVLLFFRWCSKDSHIPFQVKLRCYTVYGERESIKVTLKGLNVPSQAPEGTMCYKKEKLLHVKRLKFLRSII